MLTYLCKNKNILILYFNDFFKDHTSLKSNWNDVINIRKNIQVENAEIDLDNLTIKRRIEKTLSKLGKTKEFILFSKYAKMSLDIDLVNLFGSCYNVLLLHEDFISMPLKERYLYIVSMKQSFTKDDVSYYKQYIDKIISSVELEFDVTYRKTEA